MKKFSLLLLFILILDSGIVGNLQAGKNFDYLGKYLPSVPDVTVYVENIDRTWKEFKNSYFLAILLLQFGFLNNHNLETRN
jgi:hypothetical protein